MDNRDIIKIQVSCRISNECFCGIEHVKKQFMDGEYAISDHAIIEARKDGIDPRTVEKLECSVGDVHKIIRFCSV